MSPVASSTDEHSVARLSSSNASKKSPSGRLTSPAAYVFAPSWMANSKESHKPSNLAFSSFSTMKTHNPAPRSSNSSPYPGRPLHKLQPKPHHDINTTTTTTTINPATTATTATPPSSYRSEQPDSSGSLQESEFPILGEDAASDKRHAGRSAWSNPNAIKAKVLCPPAAASDESNAEIPLSPNDIELERLKALVPKRRSGAASSSPSP
ncbi:hypothetical protein BDB00DRAFT_362302 [Zychaea mexicana]|uniref:uncharacterized protein n=1 Tax=Zychaea mexicana TaxID=64656 RepID=UPI0022FE0C4D|nr:uncharacterized protein BDB00DRAFT_362302 [Zychaea mexicana]KAI9493688.1 hypothetical protein BDB00DRAFT_362302 [Zychaea mexicana]